MSGRLQSALIVLSVCVLASFAGGCASSGTDGDQNDPYESFNRKMFAFNQELDKDVALPAAEVYTHVVPAPGRDAIHNVLDNLSEPVTLANDILQGNASHAAETLGRIAVNTTIGVGGIADVASPMGIPSHTEDFGKTLALYGVGEGPYLMLPLFGPSNPRDATGRLVDIAFDPLTYMGFHDKDIWMPAKQVTGLIDERAQNIDTMDALQKSSVDLYATLRSLYRQHRNAEIHGGQPDLQNLPNI